MTPLHAAAREYHALGLHVIPCHPRTKRALVEWKEWQRSQPPLELLDRWWRDEPEANVALILGRGTLAVDLDGGETAEPVAGARAAERLLIARGVRLPPEAPRSRTGHGAHVFLQVDGPVPDRIAMLTTEGKKPQVDVRGVGIVVVPPSIHPDGPVYQWDVPLTMPFPEAPLFLLDLIRGPKERATAPPAGRSWVQELLGGVPEGQRDVACTRLAGLLLGKGLDAETTLAWLALWADRCDPPLPLADVRKCVRSIATKEALAEATPDRMLRAEPITEVIDRWLREGKPTLVPTPFTSLTHYLAGGWGQGELIYLGARPSVGKTALALDLARAAARAGTGVLIVSREMANTQLIRRVVAQDARVSATNLKTGRLSPVELDQVEQTLVRLRPLPVWFSDDAISLSEITRLVTGDSYWPALGLVIIDYLQLIRAPSEIRERRLQVEHISQGLKSLAVAARMPVLCLSSLSRPVKGKPAAVPTLADLRESGELEHDADIVLFLHRPKGQTETECLVAKNRDGRTGSMTLLFRPEYVAFDDPSERADPQA